MTGPVQHQQNRSGLTGPAPTESVSASEAGEGAKPGMPVDRAVAERVERPAETPSKARSGKSSKSASSFEHLANAGLAVIRPRSAFAGRARSARAGCSIVK